MEKKGSIPHANKAVWDVHEFVVDTVCRSLYTFEKTLRQPSSTTHVLFFCLWECVLSSAFLFLPFHAHAATWQQSRQGFTQPHSPFKREHAPPFHKHTQKAAKQEKESQHLLYILFPYLFAFQLPPPHPYSSHNSVAMIV
jgi:hypothetical protein